MDGTGNQGAFMHGGCAVSGLEGVLGELYSFFRFDVQSLAVIFDDPRRGHSLRTFDGGEAALSLFADAIDPRAAKLLFRAFPCPFPSKRSQARNAYLHFTGTKKPWTTFQP
jgi:hypothetical protein